ncbi:hypothetical protein F01_420920 [Burkholderia cenocepacia]|nr:hypothetical protein F01_420920 [Burkholderia cenocepacia]
MPQAWPSKPGGSLAAMMHDADGGGREDPSLRVHAESVAWRRRPACCLASGTRIAIRTGPWIDAQCLITQTATIS